MNREIPADRRIVVGVDGSPSSVQALLWAVRQAGRTASVVDAVICWLHPTRFGLSPMSVDRELGLAAGKMLAQVVAEAVGDRPPVQITESAVLGNAAGVLLERSRGPNCWSWAIGATVASPVPCSVR
jgi:nucleotide-binding universal stress UspA family protein